MSEVKRRGAPDRPRRVCDVLRLILLRIRLGARLRVGRGARVGKGVLIAIAPGAHVALGAGSTVGAAPHRRRRGHVAVGPGSVLGERCVIAARERVDRRRAGAPRATRWS